MEDLNWRYAGCSFVGEGFWNTLKSKTCAEIEKILTNGGFLGCSDENSATFYKTKKATIHYKNVGCHVQLFNVPVKLSLTIDKKSGEVKQSKSIESMEGWCAGTYIYELGTENVLVYCTDKTFLMNEMKFWSGNIAIHLSDTIEESLHSTDIEEVVFNSGFRFVGEQQEDGDTVRQYEMRILNICNGEPIRFGLPEKLFSCDNECKDYFKERMFNRCDCVM